MAWGEVFSPLPLGGRGVGGEGEGTTGGACGDWT